MKRFVLAVLALAAAQHMNLAAQAGGDVAVTSAIANENPAIAPGLLQILNDSSNGGSNVYEHRRNYLTSVIQSGGDWVLDLGVFTTKPSGRLAWLGFEFPHGSTFPSGWQKLRFITRCVTRGTNMLSMVPGEAALCGLTTEFKDAAGSSYRLYFNSDVPGTDDVNVRCLDNETTGRCKRWTITPRQTLADGRVISVGRLVKLATKKTPETIIGDFDFSFSFDITVP